MTQLHSEDISKIMAALSKAQGTIEGATKRLLQSILQV